MFLTPDCFNHISWSPLASSLSFPISPQYKNFHIQIWGSRNLHKAWSTMASIGMWNIWKYRCLNRYSRETHTIAKAITNYMDWSSGILVCTIWKPTGRLRTSRVGMSTIYLTLGNHTIGGLSRPDIRNGVSSLIGSTSPPASKSPILFLVIWMSTYVWEAC